MGSGVRVLGLPLPPKGEISPAGVFPVGGCRRSVPPEVIVVVVFVVDVVIVIVIVVVVVVEYIIILIIIIVDPFETGPAHFCQTVKLEPLFFSEASFSHHKVRARQIALLFFFNVSYALHSRF